MSISAVAIIIKGQPYLSLNVRVLPYLPPRYFISTRINPTYLTIRTGVIPTWPLLQRVILSLELGHLSMVVRTGSSLPGHQDTGHPCLAVRAGVIPAWLSGQVSSLPGCKGRCHPYLALRAYVIPTWVSVQASSLLAISTRITSTWLSVQVSSLPGC